MATPTAVDSDLEALEKAADQHLAGEEGAVEADLNASAAASGDEAAELVSVPATRIGIAVGLSMVGAALMAGGIFHGISPRVYAALAGVLGVGLAIAAARIRRTAVSSALIVVGLFAIGLLLVLPSGFDNLAHIGTLVSKAAASSKNIRPPLEMTPGWTAILAWIMGTIGFAAAWTGVSLRRPSVALLLPLPLAGIAAISVPKDEQLFTGLAVFVLFAIGLGVVSGIRRTGGSDRLPASYELRRALKALPILVGVTGLMLLVGTQTNFLFPHPLLDPELSPQKPKTIPLSQVPDKVLFEVDSNVTGPWVIGTLDVYDPSDGTWRLPPYRENQQARVPPDGVVNRRLVPGIKATITIRGMEGAVLPGMANAVLVQASGPRLTFDSRSGNLRIAEGQLEPGFSYKIAAASLPSVNDLRKVSGQPPKDIGKFVYMPAPPAAVRDLLGQAPTTSKWDEFDYLRRYVLQSVTAAGQGTPVPVTTGRVQSILGGPTKEASPFEIVALQVMLARWAGVPARIAYGFDGGEKVGQLLQVHPTHGAAFPEVFFPGYEWLPVIGTPARAKASQASDSRYQQKRADILPSNDISVPVFLPTVEPPQSLLFDQLRTYFLFAVLALLALATLYFLLPLAQKALARARRRRAAAGPRARLIQAYAEWRDHASDYGYGHPGDTPLMFVARFVPDREHRELAWLATRGLWGDLRPNIDDEMVADAEEYVRSLKRRLSQAQPFSVRISAALSRLSVRHPFDERSLRLIREEVEHVAAAA